MAQTFHEIEVLKKAQETASAVSIHFQIPDELQSQYAYQPGQYITIEREMAGEVQRRSYSLASSPMSDEWRVIVKEVPGGQCSSWLVHEVNEGDKLKIGTPEGRFVFKAQPDKQRMHYFIGAGSGITPILSMLKVGLETEPLSTFVLLYGNRSKEEAIAYDELDKLQDTYGEQLSVIHAFSSKKTSALGAVSRLFAQRGDGPLAGRIDDKKLAQAYAMTPKHKGEEHFYLCGPGDMIEMAKSWVKTHAPDAKVHTEYFTNPGQEIDHSQSVAGATLYIEDLDGQSASLTVPKGQTLLEATMDAGYDPPYSCMNGVCSSCQARLVEGEVAMENNMALMDDEVAEGLILTCQAIPKTAEVRISYGDV